MEKQDNQNFDKAKADAFAEKVMSDTTALLVTVMSSIGDRLGSAGRTQDPPSSEASVLLTYRIRLGMLWTICLARQRSSFKDRVTWRKRRHQTY